MNMDVTGEIGGPGANRLVRREGHRITAVQTTDAFACPQKAETVCSCCTTSETGDKTAGFLGF